MKITIENAIDGGYFVRVEGSYSPQPAQVPPPAPIYPPQINFAGDLADCLEYIENKINPKPQEIVS